MSNAPTGLNPDTMAQQMLEEGYTQSSSDMDPEGLKQALKKAAEDQDPEFLPPSMKLAYQAAQKMLAPETLKEMLEKLAEEGVIEDTSNEESTEETKQPSNEKLEEGLEFLLETYEAVAKELSGAEEFSGLSEMLSQWIAKFGELPGSNSPILMSFGGANEGISTWEDGEISSETPMLTDAYAQPDKLLTDGVIFIAVMTNLIAEVAQVLREIMAGESKLRGDSLIAMVQTQLQSARERFIAGMHEAQAMRLEAKAMIAQGVSSIVSGAVQLAACAASYKMAKSSTRSDIKTNDARAHKLANKLDNRYDTNGNWKGTATDLKKSGLPAKIDRNNVHQLAGADSDPQMRTINESNTAIRGSESAIMQQGTQVSGALSSIINGTGTIVAAGFKMEAANEKELAAMSTFLAEALQALVGIFEKVYQSSQDQSSKVWQLLQDFVRQLETLAQTINQIGRS